MTKMLQSSRMSFFSKNKLDLFDYVRLLLRLRWFYLAYKIEKKRTGQIWFSHSNWQLANCGFLLDSKLFCLYFTWHFFNSRLFRLWRWVDTNIKVVFLLLLPQIQTKVPKFNDYSSIRPIDNKPLYNDWVK